ncbi:MAG: recombinase family protein [Planctomycetota bacterium]|jgi:DNA invertase Pin-like site-specific DNA recombinase
MRRIALYARCSTAEQHPEAQLHELRAYARRRGAEAVEHVDIAESGAKDRRPALDRLLAATRRREVDAVVVVKLDRLARSVRHLTALAGEFEALGVDLVVLDQSIDTGTPAGRLLFHVLGSIAEFERDLIRDRTRQGLAAARRRGARLGRPRRLDAAAAERARDLRRCGASVREVAQALGVGLGTAHAAVRGVARGG